MSFERLAPEEYDTLEGVPDPAENPRLFGHPEAVGLAEAYRAGRLPHGLLLSGSHGIGKATLAFRLARHLLRYPDPAAAPPVLEDADPASGLFRQIATGAHPSVLHLTRPRADSGKGFKGAVTVDEVRRIGKLLSMRTHDGSYRVVIVDSADDMNPNAANALLKNLEEPPARTVFILISHAAGGLLPTIRSRCRLVRLGPLGPADLGAALRAVGIEPPADEAALRDLSDRAGGSVREAILLTEHGGRDIAAQLERLARAPARDVATAHKLADLVAAREGEVRFGIFNRHALDMLVTAAGEAARQGALRRAAALAEAEAAARLAISETEAYNLDKKQHALMMIARLQDAMRM